MLSSKYQHTTQIDQRSSVQIKGIYRCPATSSDANNVDVIKCPSEVLSPLVATRVEQLHYLRGNWIQRLRLDAFVPVAPCARKRKIVQSGQTAE